MKSISAIVVSAIIFVSLTSHGMANDNRSANKTIWIPTDHGFNVDVRWFDPAHCPEPIPKKFYFKVGQHFFATDPSSIKKGMLKNIHATQPKNGKTMAKVNVTAGCRSDPFDFSALNLKMSSKDLPAEITLVEAPTLKGKPSRVEKYMAHLIKSKQCREVQKARGMVLCTGSKTENSIKVPVLLVPLIRDGNFVRLKSSPVPVHAVCEKRNNISQCRVDYFTHGNARLSARIDSQLSAPKIVKTTLQLAKYFEQILTK